jgi:hypothetical protein
MTIDTVWAQLEQDLAWRTDEIRLLSNSRNGLKSEGERDRFRRAQLVMLYAHAEGFCKVALLLYLKAINETEIPCSAASDQLVASAFSELFHAVQFGDRKGRVFATKLPSDSKLMLPARRRDFVAEYDRLMLRAIHLPESIVNTESNLTPVVLRRNLFRLGFAPDLMQQYEVGLDELVNRRNNIAHGIDDSVVKATDYERLQRNVFQAMDWIAFAIVDALDRSLYLHPAGNRGTEFFWVVGEMR